jgi:hypothetical protein
MHQGAAIQDEFERLQQLAANRAAASAMGASKKWSKWGGTSATAATDKPAATPTDSSDAKKGGTKGKRPRDDEDSGTPPSKRAATATTAVTAAPASASTSVLPAVAKPSGETPQPVSTGAAAGRPLQNANRLPRQDDDVITVDLRDLTFVLERDPHYARSTLLYEIMESQPWHTAKGNMLLSVIVALMSWQTCLTLWQITMRTAGRWLSMGFDTFFY